MTGILFLAGALWAFIAAGQSPEGGIANIIVYRPFLVALVATLAVAAVNFVHYAIFLFPLSGRVEKWYSDRRLRGLP